MPEKVKQMQTIWEQEARKYNVLPLDNDTFARALAPRPSATAGKTVFTYKGVNPGINSSNAPNILARSYTMTAEVDVPPVSYTHLDVYKRQGHYGSMFSENWRAAE